MRLLPLLAALAALALLAPATAPAARKMEVIVQDDSVFLYQANYYQREVAFRQLRTLGASRLRVNVLWFLTMPESQALATTKPAQIDYDWWAAVRAPSAILPPTGSGPIWGASKTTGGEATRPPESSTSFNRHSGADRAIISPGQIPRWASSRMEGCMRATVRGSSPETTLTITCVCASRPASVSRMII